MSVQYKDYYDILGVSRTASDKEIRSAYRKLAREFHPDVNPSAGDRFKDINEAYEALKDPEKRRLYDNLGANWRQGQNFTPPPGFEGFGGAGGYQQVDLSDLFGGAGFGGHSGFSDFFESLFGQVGMGQAGRGGFHTAYEQPGFGQQTRPGARQPRPQSLDVEQALPLTLEEVANGATRSVRLQHSGRSVSVNIPKGVRSGAKIRLAGEGQPGYGGQTGDAFLRVSYQPHRDFQVDGDNLIHEALVPVPDLVLGGELRVPTLGGEGTMTIPPATQSGRTLRLKGQGLPKKGGGSGDLLVRLKAQIPEAPTEREKELYAELRAQARQA